MVKLRTVHYPLQIFDFAFLLLYIKCDSIKSPVKNETCSSIHVFYGGSLTFFPWHAEMLKIKCDCLRNSPFLQQTFDAWVRFRVTMIPKVRHSLFILLDALLSSHQLSGQFPTFKILNGSPSA